MNDRLRKDNTVILLVEDNQNDEELTKLAIVEGQISSELVVARNGQEALDYLFGNGKYSGRDICEQPRLILLDLKIPKIDGLEVLRRIRADERTKFLPVVILTSSREISDQIACYTLGANSYIQKLVDYTQFVDVLRQIGSYWLGLNETPSTCYK